MWNTLDACQKQAALSRPAAMLDSSLITGVRSIMNDVSKRGDAALFELTESYDGATLSQLRVPIGDIEAAWNGLSDADKAAMQLAKNNICAFHEAQIPDVIDMDVMPGVNCRREIRPIDSAGLYVPGGTAPLVSTLMMLALPAKIAGVPRCVVTTPPALDGHINTYILAAAYLCDIDEIYTIGGAQAIAALAYGTQTVPKVAKIFGPGNAWVATAKSLAALTAGGPAIDLPAGPSEAMVIADDTSNPVFVASDLLSQAEHDTQAQVIAVVKSEEYAETLKAEIEHQVSTLPRETIARAALENARILITQSEEEMLQIINTYAPEHLILQTKNAADLVPKVRNAGSVFVGPWTPESVGDYAIGSNHTLPTYGAARAYSGVTLESFITYMCVQTLTRAGLEALGPTVEHLANMEGLTAHRRAVSLRLESPND